jgi:hypothetical protein
MLFYNLMMISGKKVGGGYLTVDSQGKVSCGNGQQFLLQMSDVLLRKPAKFKRTYTLVGVDRASKKTRLRWGLD